MAHKNEEQVEEQQEDDDIQNVDDEITKNNNNNNIIKNNNDIKISDDGGDGVGGSGSKAPRLPRWTRQEILVLIQGKKVAENRVRRGSRTAMMGGSSSSVEPKWATVSAYCKRHGVNRGSVQCRKRWSNLAGDYKKIKEWEANVKDESESFWLLRNDLRRERKLPGFFDREVFDILNGTTPVRDAVDVNAAQTPLTGMMLFDSGRTGAEGFPEFERAEVSNDELSRSQEGEPEHEPHVDDDQRIAVAIPLSISAPTPISAKQYQHIPEVAAAPGSHEKQPASKTEIESTSQGGRKRRRPEVEEDDERVSLEEHLIKVLENNGRVLSDQLQVQNSNLKLDREERKEHATSLVAVLNKLADALAKIADKL